MTVRKWENFRCFVWNEISEMFLIFQWLMTPIVADIAARKASPQSCYQFRKLQSIMEGLKQQKAEETSSKRKMFHPSKQLRFLSSLAKRPSEQFLATFLIGGVCFNFPSNEITHCRKNWPGLTTVSQMLLVWRPDLEVSTKIRSLHCLGFDVIDRLSDILVLVFTSSSLCSALTHVCRRRCCCCRRHVCCCCCCTTGWKAGAFHTNPERCGRYSKRDSLAAKTCFPISWLVFVREFSLTQVFFFLSLQKKVAGF